ncbi:MAG: orotate phosphoribosyltransferase [Thermoprotei archaeon]|nr:MAG: orotate phosphoribosyltransferase [Thermoprotei archaeon]
MELVGVCMVCGRGKARHTCRLCGRLVCEGCFDPSESICLICKSGRSMSSNLLR